MTQIQVLLVEDNPADIVLLREALAQDRRSVFELVVVERLAQALECLQKQTFAAILLDLNLPDSQGLATLQQICQAAPAAPVVALLGLDDENLAQQTLQAGAQDSLVKHPQEVSAAGRALRYAIASKNSEQRFYTVFHASPTPQIITQLATGRILDANKAQSRMVGLTREEMLGQTLFELGIWAKPAERTKMYQVLQVNDRVREMQIEIRTRSGETRILAVSTEAIELQGEKCILSSATDITERKKAEDNLRESNETAQAILNAATESVFLMELDGTVIAANETSAARLGTNLQDLIGANIFDFLPASMVEVRKKRLKRIASEGQPMVFEDERSGIWMENSVYPIFDQTQKVHRVAVYGRDITERKHTESIVYAQRDLARSINQSNSLETGLSLCLENAIKLSGLDSGGVYLFDPAGRQLELILHRGLGSAFIEAVTVYQSDAPSVRLISAGQSFYLSSADPVMENDLYRQEGLQTLAIVPIQHQGKVIGCLNLASHSLTQIAERERQALEALAVEIGNFVEYLHTQASLRESEERFRSLFENGGVMMLIIEPDSGRIIDANPAAVEFYGYSRSQLISMNINQINQLTSDEVFAEIQKAKQEERSSFIFSHRLADGELRTVEVHSHPITMQDVPLLYSIIFDITERKQAEDERQKLITALSARTTELGLLLAAGQALGETLERRQIYEIIYHYIREALPCEMLVLSSYDPLTGMITCEYLQTETGPQDISGFPPIPIEPPGQGTQSRVIHSGESLLLPDYEQALKTARTSYFFDESAQIVEPPADEEERTRSAIIVPLKVDGQVSGALQIFSSHLNAHTPEHLRFVEALAFHISAALSNAHLFNELEQRVRSRTLEIETIRQRLELATRAAELGVWDWNVKTKELIWDEQVYAIYGVSKDTFQVSVDSFHSIVYPEDLANLLQFTRRVLDNKQTGQVKYRVMRSDGSIGYVKVHGAVLCDAHGQPENIVGVVQDITQEKLAENTLRASEAQLRISRDRLSAANAALEKAARMKDEFLASMSHELRTPLTGILGLSEAMQLSTYGALTEKQGKALKNIEESGRHLLTLINDILDLSKIEAGMLDLNIEPVPLAEICRSSLQLTKGLAQKKQHSVDFSMKPATVYLRGDARRLKQMLVNLLSNAIKFTPENGALGLEVLALETEQAIKITVWDKGIGIAPENIERLFQPFVQLESSLARQYEGTGLGLSLVQRMAELHGGSVQVESTLGVGSRFTIRLPWSPGTTQPIPLASTEARSLEKALIVDDNEIDAGQLTRYLRILGLETLTHPAGQNVVELAKREKPGVILLELHLPDQHGFEVLVKLKADPETRGIPVVICSVEEKRSQAISLGAVGYLVKPLAVTDLRNELNRIASGLDLRHLALPASRSTGPLILIVDDNEMIIETLGDFLDSQNFHVTAARSGMELLEVAPEIHPDIILMDIQMPGMDGLEATRRIRAHPDPRVARAPVIALTALAMPGDRERCLAAGANAYMSKPVGLKQLAETIRKLLERNNE